MQIPDKEQIWAAIQEVANALGVAAEYVWEVVMKQQVLNEGWVPVIVGGFFFLIVFGVAIMFLNWGREDEDYFFGAVFTGALSIIPLIFLVEGIRHILNPGYYAFKSIIGMF